MVWTLDGPFATADYSYRLTSDFVQFDTTGFTGLRAEGRGRLSPWPMRVPIRLSARAITGIGDVAGAMLANPSIEGWLTLTPKLVRGDGLKLTSAKWNGKLSVLIDLVSGQFPGPALGRDAALPDPRPRHRRRDDRPQGGARPQRPWLACRRARPRPGCGASTTASSATSRAGLPSLTTNLERGSDGIVHFTNLQIYSPKLRLSGSVASGSGTAPSTSSQPGGRRNTGR